MFCYQCQEAAKGSGCTIKGVCGKTEPVSDLQDLLIYVTKGTGFLAQKLREKGVETKDADRFVFESLFTTITNANFDDARMVRKIQEGNLVRKALRQKMEQQGMALTDLPDAALWETDDREKMLSKSKEIGVLNFEKVEDIRSLKELLIYGMKGVAAYAEHAYNLGYEKEEIFEFLHLGLAATLRSDIELAEMVDLVMECGKYGVEVMALLDAANTGTYGNPEITKVNIGVRNNPAILITGHDMKDMEELLKQTEGTGVDVYTHSEM
ncbi:MAG: hydroxylamine reductase, partial [Bacteroidales bacterium]|nr:hydroxylamine reductase [Bacteroidales bacterium]